MTQNAPNPAEAYDQYLGPAMFVPWARVLLEHAAPQPGERVLDLACGTGIVTRQVAPILGAGGKVVGLDISPAMLAVARSHPAPDGAAIDWREGNASALDLPDQAFDLLLCQQGFQFFPDRTAAARGMCRALKDGGRAVLSVWRGLEDHEVFAALFEAEARHLGLAVEELATPFSLGDAEQLRELLSGAGFRRIEIMRRTMQVRFPSPERFVAMTVMAGAAVIPQLAKEDPAAQSALVEAVAAEAEQTVRRYRHGGWLSFPMTAHTAIGYR